MKHGAELIAEERRRQIEKEGWTPEHDSQHDDGGLVDAAICYAEQATGRSWLIDRYPDGAERYHKDEMPPDWPWAEEWWKPKDPIRDLVRAGALIAAEIDRLQRGQ